MNDNVVSRWRNQERPDPLWQVPQRTDHEENLHTRLYAMYEAAWLRNQVLCAARIAWLIAELAQRIEARVKKEQETK